MPNYSYVKLMSRDVIVSDEKLEDDDMFVSFVDESFNFKQYKIIAGAHHAPLKIDYSALSSDDCYKIGWIDIGKIAEAHGLRMLNEYKSSNKDSYIEGFINGMSVNKNRFDVNDMKGLLNVCVEASKLGTSVFIKRKANEYINSLLIPKKIKIDGLIENNSFKITKVYEKIN